MSHHEVQSRHPGVRVEVGYQAPDYWYDIYQGRDRVRCDLNVPTLYDLIVATRSDVDWESHASVIAELVDEPWQERAEEVGEFGPALLIDEALRRARVR